MAVVTDALIDPAARVPGMRLTDSEREGILDRNHGEEGLAPYRVTRFPRSTAASAHR